MEDFLRKRRRRGERVLSAAFQELELELWEEERTRLAESESDLATQTDDSETVRKYAVTRVLDNLFLQPGVVFQLQGQSEPQPRAESLPEGATFMVHSVDYQLHVVEATLVLGRLLSVDDFLARMVDPEVQPLHTMARRLRGESKGTGSPTLLQLTGRMVDFEENDIRYNNPDNPVVNAHHPNEFLGYINNLLLLGVGVTKQLLKWHALLPFNTLENVKSLYDVLVCEECLVALQLRFVLITFELNYKDQQDELHAHGCPETDHSGRLALLVLLDRTTGHMEMVCGNYGFGIMYPDLDSSGESRSTDPRIMRFHSASRYTRASHTMM